MFHPCVKNGTKVRPIQLEPTPGRSVSTDRSGVGRRGTEGTGAGADSGDPAECEAAQAAPAAPLAAITQAVYLIRSQSVGITSVTEMSKDGLCDVLAQLGSRIQHQLRADALDNAKALRVTVSAYPSSG